MELWLLAAGALVLIGITLWIVWPAQSADTVGDPVRGEEVSRTPMTDSARPELVPQGDRFEDQYTSATADLSAGGVAAAFNQPASTDQMPNGEPQRPHSVPTQDPVPQTRGQRWPEASLDGERIGEPSRVENFPYSTDSPDNRGFVQPKTVGIGAGTLLVLGGAVGGTWLYTRWQRERNKPINRLRRGARAVASRVGERLPPVDDLPLGPAPVSGAASALVLAALLGSRALRRDDGAEKLDAARSRVRDKGRSLDTADLRKSINTGRQGALSRSNDLVESGRKQSRRWAARLPSDRLPDVEPRQAGIFGLGFGGLAIVAGGSYFVWRLLRGDANPRQTWYAGE